MRQEKNLIKDMSYKNLLLTLTLYGYMLPSCFIFTKAVRKSINRYWHRINKIKRANKWAPRIIGEFQLGDRTVKIQHGHRCLKMP